MLYCDFQGKKLSRLGFGGMRLPLDNKKAVDEAETARLFDYAIDNGINYFDTAFFYHAGNSESVMGKVLSRHPRDSWYIADKLPGNFIDVTDGKLAMDLSGMGMGKMTFDTPRDIFEYQLRKTGVERFDFYMLHNVAEVTLDLYTDDSIGMVDFLLAEKKAGRIGHIGFSAHGRCGTLAEFLDKYNCFEFALIQLNYLDRTLQDAGKKYELLTDRGIPVFVMEPVRGGKLAAPGAGVEAILKAARPDDTPAKWAFRYLQSLPNVHVTVSGMSNMDQLAENVRIMSCHEPVSSGEMAVLERAVDAMGEFVPCTACRYCCDTCPQKLDIPMLIETYNEASMNLAWWYIADVLSTLSESKKPGACINCGQCAAHCPQNIDIADVLKKFDGLISKR